MALTRDEVVAKAIELLDEDGLDALTLRRLAKALGVSAPTLYWHVKDKRQLLDQMAECMIALQRAKEPPLPKDGEWKDMIAEMFRRQYRTLISYRDAARVMAGNRPTDLGLPHIERWLGMWTDAGFSPGEALTLIMSVGNYVMGSALEYQAEAERARLKDSTKRGGDRHDPPDPALYPNLTAAVMQRRSGLNDPHDAFEAGLSLILSGLEARRREIVERR
ncbi:TetR/AcrR family transcriptional regulator C-terminal domain-containing protein [Cucumibacter marinus]|uniref:TetR/AcrR family transcriptional regulator C-terminal domain-containing protein n=1 Tax=Cucumibacter marinus TaxID=1121252 RepID=UPI000409FE19|nr:TetR/AcrR family transcriptional regulator C-terminal domain-containing protein [Cucumibacter marinus]